MPMSHQEALQTMAAYAARGMFSPRKALDAYKPSQLERKAVAYRNAERAGITNPKDMAAYARGHYGTPEHGYTKQRVAGRTVYRTKSPSDAAKLLRGMAKSTKAHPQGKRVDISVKSKSTGKLKPILQNKPRPGGDRGSSRGISAKHIVGNMGPTGPGQNPLADAYREITGAGPARGPSPRDRGRRSRLPGRLPAPDEDISFDDWLDELADEIPDDVTEEELDDWRDQYEEAMEEGESYSGGGGGGGGGGGDGAETSDPSEIDWPDIDEYELTVWD